MRLKFLLFFCWVSCFLYGKNIALVTVVIGSAYSDATQTGILSKKAYCDKHGYDFICYTEKLDPLRHHAWQKIKAVQSALNEYDWVFWSDADSIIMNKNIRLEDLIDDNYSFIICYDNMSHVVNSGEFLIKKNAWAFDFLDKIYKKEEFLNHPWWENAAIIKVIEEAPDSQDFVKILPQRAMNSFAYEVCGSLQEACFQKGDFIVHFPSVRNLSLLKSLMWKYYLNAN